jgi:hypothetical protein
MASYRLFADIRATRLVFAGLLAGAILGAIAGRAAAQQGFAGSWIIAGAVVAPWAADPTNAADSADAARLVGKRLDIGAHSLRAPRPLGCVKAAYAFREAAPDTLFEGSLNADGAGRPADPVAAARSLGVVGPKAQVMVASCSEVEFVLTDPDTILFGLNNRLFTAKRAK